MKKLSVALCLLTIMPVYSQGSLLDQMKIPLLGSIYAYHIYSATQSKLKAALALISETVSAYLVFKVTLDCSNTITNLFPNYHNLAMRTRSVLSVIGIASSFLINDKLFLDQKTKEITF